MNPLTLIVHESQQKPTHSIIWMHGLGAYASDFEPILPHLAINPYTRVIFPQANQQKITINHYQPMPAWYDIYDPAVKITDHQGINGSYQALHNIYQDQCASGIAAENILWVGFSQGGLMALHMGLHLKCAGIIALSTYYPNDLSIPEADNQSLTIKQIHGNQDPVVSYDLAVNTHQRLKIHHYRPQLDTFAMAHTINFQAIDSINKTLNILGF